MTYPSMEERFCVNPHCAGKRWSVTRCSTLEQLWQISACSESFLVAASCPICPYCGDDLLTPFKVEGGFTQPVKVGKCITRFKGSEVQRNEK